MGTALAILRALYAAWNVYKQEKDLRNRPDMVKQKVQEQAQVLRDRINAADAVLADPNATQAQHEEALRQLRLAES